ncbi:putative gustatory receptor 98b [Calliphora vicina]|uniref:putative gustatory receptor 98b n=1 Tax=Calliphora vicina TaxID=7373 RepID=UPI00325B8B31
MLMLLESLKCLREKVENEVDRQQPLVGYYHKTLRQNQACLMEIWFVVYKLEQYFGWSILILFFYNGIIILCTVSWAYVQYLYEIKATYQILRLAYITVVLLNMLLLCYLTQKCINEYQKFSYLLLNFKLYPHDVQMRMTTREYSLQLMHQRIQFTCNGYMDIDLSYYGKTILVIFAYVVIVLQFKLTDISDANSFIGHMCFQFIDICIYHINSLQMLLIFLKAILFDGSILVLLYAKKSIKILLVHIISSKENLH